MKALIIIIGIIGLVVAAVLAYRNNQKKADQVIDKVASDAQTVEKAAAKVGSAAKSL